MFGISGLELVIILVFSFVIFGPDKLPQVARTIGRTMQMFKSAQQDMERVIKSEMYASENRTQVTISAGTDGSANGVRPAATTTSSAEQIWAATENGFDKEEAEE